MEWDENGRPIALVTEWDENGRPATKGAARTVPPRRIAILSFAFMGADAMAISSFDDEGQALMSKLWPAFKTR